MLMSTFTALLGTDSQPAALAKQLLRSFAALFCLIALAVPAGADISGTVFRDIDGDGIDDAGEPGIFGITVTAFVDGAGAPSATTTTNTSGDYTLTLGAGNYRVEFGDTSATSTFRSGPAGNTRVAFAANGATGVDTGLHNPLQFCQANPDLVTNCYIDGNQDSTGDVLISVAYTDSGESPPATLGDEALANQIGTTWGLAHNRTADILFAGSHAKRHAGYGDQDTGTAGVQAFADATGTIWQIPTPNDDNTAGSQEFVNLNDLFGGNPFGTNTHDVDTNSPLPDPDLNSDVATYAAVGKTSMGDMDISDDDLTLWLVNMQSRELWEVSLGTDPANPAVPDAADVNTFALDGLFDCENDGGTSHPDLRPFGVNFHDGRVYVGAVCTSETAGDTDDTDPNTGLRALVFRFNPLTDTFDATPAVNFLLDYDRGCLLDNNGTCLGGPALTTANWQGWEDDFQAAAPRQPVGTVVLFTAELGYPQPMLTDIDFAADGTMVLGLRDRWGDQLGRNETFPDGTSPGTGDADALGDILRAEDPDGDGVFAVVGAVTGINEHFGADDWTDTVFSHSEVVNGGLAVWAGDPGGDAVATVMDPLDGGASGVNDFSGGMRWFDIAGGTTDQRLEIYDSDNGGGGVFFGKANGLGDLEAICNAAPLQVGNRVWNDLDNDGVQDPGETGINGLTVFLFEDPDGIPNNGDEIAAGSVVTAGDGSYIFAVDPATNYYAQVDIPANFRAAILDSVQIGDGNDDARDSDGQTGIVGGAVVASFTTGGPGANDHTIDLGFLALEFDWADLPDGPYATLAASNGPNHEITSVGNCFLGGAPDAELDGQPNANATGDDIDFTGDDEDGVVFLTPINPGSVADIQVTSSAAACVLNAWVDFNSDGDFLDAGEQVATNLAMLAGANLLNDIPVPAGATGVMAARFRVTNLVGQGGGSTTGPATTGEVEDYGLGALGDFVWLDNGAGGGTAGDGVQDPAEPALPGITVNLLDGIGGAVTDGAGVPITVLTDVNGNYEFPGLPAGNYQVEFVLTSSYTFTLQDVGSDALDSDANPVTGTTANVAVGPGVNNTTVDAGAIPVPIDCPTGSILYSLDFDRDAFNAPIASGATVDTQWSALGITFALTSVNPPGTGPLMIFDSNVASGGDADLASPNDTCDDGLNNGTLPGVGAGGEIGLAGENCTPLNNVLIISEDGDATDPDDNGVGGVMTVTFDTPLFKAAVGIIDDAEFTMVARDSLGNTLSTNSSNPGFGDNAFHTVITNTAGVAELEIGGPSSGGVTSLELCVPLGSIGNYVWVDENSDGLQDAGEPGVPNAVVELWEDGDGDGTRDTLLATTVTDSAGGYLFPGLPPGTYFVDVLDGTDGTANTLPAGLTQTAPSTNPNSDFGNQDHSGTNGYMVMLPIGAEDLTADFGYNYNPDPDVNGNTGTAAIGDRVWIDTDGDGFQDPNELGLAGVTVDLLCAGPDGEFGTGDDVASSTVTDATGNYLFDGLTPSACTVTVTPPAGYTQTGDPDHFGTTGVNDNTTTNPIILGPGDVFLNADFGYQPPAAQDNSVGDTVWFDLDGDGIEDPGEPGIPGVTVKLALDSDGDGIFEPFGNDGVPGGGDDEPIVASDTTDASGNYLFDGVPDGNYVVCITDTDSVLLALENTGDPDDDGVPGNGDEDGAGAVDLDSGGASAVGVTDPTQDFGYTDGLHDPAEGAIGDTVFLDADSSGTPDPGEGIEGVVVNLFLDPDGIPNNGDEILVSIDTTDENGNYFFGNLDPLATYTVRVDTTTLPLGLTNTVDPDGGLDDESSTDLSVSGPIDLAQDFGYEPAGGQTVGSIGNLVWLDQNADGINDGPNGPDGIAATDDDEPGLAGKTLDLYYDANGNGLIDVGEPKIASTVTDGSGNYLFSNLPTDDGGGSYDYVVNVTDTADMLGGYWHSLGDQSQAVDDTSKNDTYGVSLTPGTPDVLTVDFGYYVDPAAVGNRVWIDNNFNGIQDPGELAGIPNVEVTLTITYPGGIMVSLQTTTDANGFYEFQNLLADEDYNGDGVGPEPTYVISIDLADPDNIAALAGVGLPTMTDVNDPVDDFRDSDDPTGVAAFATQGITDMTVDAPTPGNEADPQGSYDFGFRALEFDWGDLPDGPYATLAASSGPNHETTSIGNVFLGGAPDTELDGQPTANGLGDDTDLNGDDEDGVLFLTPLVPGASADIDVTASGAGFLSVFIDFNSDGDFADAGEVVAADLAVAGGTTTLNIPVVPVGSTGTMAARFRITNSAGQGGAAATGPATTGEVEDYVLGCIGDLVWDDLDGDGIQDGGLEVGVSGVTVTLVSPNFPFLPIVDANALPITTTTDVNGNYEFCGLPTVENSGLANPGDYRILFDLPAGFVDFSPPNVDDLNPNPDQRDSDADQDTLGTGIEGLAPIGLPAALPPITINSGVTDPTVDAGLRAITAALITSTAAYNDGGEVVFEFSTGYEALSASFEVYRFDDAVRDYVPVTERPISALLGAPQGGVYRAVDEHAPFSAGLSYVVVEHQVDGKTRAYGPFKVELDARGDRAPLDENSSARPHVSERLKSRMAVARREVSLAGGAVSGGSGAGFADPGIAVYTAQVNAREAGLYYVASSDLAATLGLSEANVRAAVQKGGIVVENQGRAIAWLEANGSGDGLYFYGEAIDSLYTLDNTYWLKVNSPGVPMELADARLASPAPGGVFTSTERFEEDLLPSINATLETEVDFWFWDGINAASADTTRTFDVVVPNSVAGNATLTARFAGATNGFPTNDHHAIVRVNGVEIGTAVWGGMERYEAEMAFDGSLLTPLTTIEVEGTLAEGSTQSIFFIDGFDLAYTRAYEAFADNLFLTGDGNAIVTVEGLSSGDVAVFDLSDPALPAIVSNVLVEAGAGGFQASFVPADESTPYLVTTLSAAQAGSNLRPHAPAIELIAGHHSFDHVVIAPAAWMTEAEDFSAYRNSQGLTSLAVSIEEVYNAFSWGNPTPWAIRDFLAYARDNWVAGPDYALLAGRGTFDHRDLLGGGDSFIPVVLVGTSFGLVSTDNVLADLQGGDSVPEVAIGRLPIVSGNELAVYLSKVEAYDASSGTWRGRATLLADNADAAGDFPTQSDAVASVLAGYEQEFIYLSELDVDTARAALVAAWNDGAQLINYIGHGGVTQAAAEGLLRVGDMDLLTNGDRLPIVSALTCVVGRSDIPNLESLAEALVTDADGGAIAVWAPTGVSLAGAANELNLFYAQSLERAGDNAPLGDIVLQALSAFGAGGGAVEMLNAYAIAGDPAVQLP